EARPHFGGGLGDVRRGAAGVAGSGDALREPERGNTFLDAVAFGASRELLERDSNGGGHSRTVGRARVELRLRRTHLQCAASLVGIDPSANRHQSLSLLPILAISSPSASRPTTLVRPSESVPPVTGSVIAAMTAATSSSVTSGAEAGFAPASKAPARCSRVSATSPVAREDPSRHLTATE